MCVISIEYCWLHLSIFFNLELRQSEQHDQQGHQLKALGVFACAGLFDLNTPCFRTNEEILPMKAQSKSLIGFMNRHIGPVNAVQNNPAAMLLGINPPQYNPQHALPIHAYNNQNHRLGWEDATYVRSIGGYV